MVSLEKHSQKIHPAVIILFTFKKIQNKLFYTDVFSDR